MSSLIPNFKLDAVNPDERLSKLKFLLSEGLESLENGNASECAYCIQMAGECVQLVLDDLDETEVDHGSPVTAETTVLWIYSKLVQAGVPFDSVEQKCVDFYFRNVEPQGEQS